jgi:hypothetical protein
MTPFQLAWKITQFAFWLILFLVVIPGLIWYGSLFSISAYSEWRLHKREAAAEAARAVHVKDCEAKYKATAQTLKSSAGSDAVPVGCADVADPRDPYAEFGGHEDHGPWEKYQRQRRVPTDQQVEACKGSLNRYKKPNDTHYYDDLSCCLGGNPAADPDYCRSTSVVIAKACADAKAELELDETAKRSAVKKGLAPIWRAFPDGTQKLNDDVITEKQAFIHTYCD